VNVASVGVRTIQMHVANTNFTKTVDVQVISNFERTYNAVIINNSSFINTFWLGGGVHFNDVCM
jgi:hypothetical protein